MKKLMILAVALFSMTTLLQQMRMQVQQQQQLLST